MTSCPNSVLHPWLEGKLAGILAAMPTPSDESTSAGRRAWERWQEGLSIRPTLPDEPPPLRMLLVLDNLAGHKTPSFVAWLFDHGVMPLYTPVGGSWLNMAEIELSALTRDMPARVGNRAAMVRHVGWWKGGGMGRS